MNAYNPPRPLFSVAPNASALAIGAHWDDLLLGCFGTLLRLVHFHDCTVTVAVLCDTYTTYYGCRQPALAHNTQKMYESLCESAGFKQLSVDTNLCDRQFSKSPDKVEDVVLALSETYSDCNLILTPTDEDSHQDHALTGQAVKSYFREPTQAILEYEVKRHNNHSFVPNVVIGLDHPLKLDGLDEAPIGELKIKLLSEMIVHGRTAKGNIVAEPVENCAFLFGEDAIRARLLINTLDYADNRSIRFGEAFRGRIAL